MLFYISTLFYLLRIYNHFVLKAFAEYHKTNTLFVDLKPELNLLCIIKLNIFECLKIYTLDVLKQTKLFK